MLPEPLFPFRVIRTALLGLAEHLVGPVDLLHPSDRVLGLANVRMVLSYESPGGLSDFVLGGVEGDAEREDRITPLVRMVSYDVAPCAR